MKKKFSGVKCIILHLNCLSNIFFARWKFFRAKLNILLVLHIFKWIFPSWAICIPCTLVLGTIIGSTRQHSQSTRHNAISQNFFVWKIKIKNNWPQFFCWSHEHDPRQQRTFMQGAKEKNVFMIWTQQEERVKMRTQVMKYCPYVTNYACKTSVILLLDITCRQKEKLNS